MKKSFLTALLLALSSFCFSAPVDTVIVNNGKWSQTTSWNLGRLPADGDTVVIPANMTLILDYNLNMSAQSIYMKIYGVLNLKVGKLDLGLNSVIMIYAGGSINNINGNNSERIQIGGVSKYSGSEGTISGPSFASKTTGSSPSGFSVPITLPVKFVGFSVATRGSDILIQWSTSEEINAFEYQLERSADGAGWTTIAHIPAAGNSNSVNNYSYTDKNAGSKTAYYRVKQVDLDRRFAYTAIKATKAQGADIRIMATENRLVLQFPEQINAVSVHIISLNGQVIRTLKIEQAVGQMVLNTEVKGNYVVSVSNGQSINIARQVIL